MTKLVNIADLKSHLSDVIAKVSKSGDPVIIGKYGKPVAKLIPFSEEEKSRNVGFGKHLVMTNISDLQHQVDEPVDTEILEGFYQ
ncbi:MAG: type II toxin-antitoxin system prevent-host-death family antitoxin [Emcibacter sp.]|nr:type II toxin-antitoxin system prevent-host-death family antitoxin [Emcibacter sp.]